MKLLRQESGVGPDGKISGSMVTSTVSRDGRTTHLVSKDVTLRLEEDGDLFHYQPGPYFQDPRLTQGTRFARPWYPGCKVDHAVRTVGSRPAYHAMQAWLEYCSTNHKECQNPASEKIDIIRVIDVVRRVIVSYRDCNRAKYAALSYVWGKAHQPRMGESPVLPAVLPRTIEHALLAVQNLGLQYLWVDSLCIKQDSDEDKMRQINIMGEIYSGAFMTLIVLDGTSADSGLAGVNQDVPRIPQALLNIGSLQLRARCPRFDYALLNSPWMKRGWTYQEGVLSRRCMFFSSDQVYYRCNNMYCSEDLHDAYEFGFHSKEETKGVVPVQLQNAFEQLLNPFTDTENKANRNEDVSLLKQLLDQYLYRTISFDADAIVAFSALLQHLESSSMPSGFLWGLPRSDFRNSLLWVGGHERRSSLNNDLPSWSWAGWKFFRDGLSTRARAMITIRAAGPADVRPPLQIWHNGQELKIDKHETSAGEVAQKADASAMQDLWVDVESPTSMNQNTTPTPTPTTMPPTPSALLIEALILTVPSTYFANSGLALCFPDALTCRCPTYSSGTRNSLEKSGFDRRFLVANTWIDDRKSALRLLLLGGEGDVMAREGYVELDVRAQGGVSERVVLDGLRRGAQMRRERFWLV
ncbi:hypothetical protein J1614_002988 [Plenodomus biglobosus]|nr:hypothetical protein J1614_002988 [Plenodomus biglobosus]